jgi:hypothetical protein
MVVIRRLVDRRRAYTGIFLRGEPPRIFPTTDQEHARILQIFKQDRAHENVENDFSFYALGQDALPAGKPNYAKNPDTASHPASPEIREIEPNAHELRRGESVASRWLIASAKR